MKALIVRASKFPVNGNPLAGTHKFMLTAVVGAIGLISLFTNVASANTVWLGAVNDDWFEAGNWNNGIPDTDFASSQRAQIEASTDLEYWPVIKSGQTVDLSQRLFLPMAPVGVEPTTYARLTIESGGTLNALNDFRAGEDGGNEFQVLIGSLNVAGTLTLGNRSRFGNNDYMTIDVDLTGTMIHTDPEQAFRIGGGENSSADFDVSGTGSLSVTGPFEVLEGSLLSLADDAKVTLNEYEYEIEDEAGIPIGFATFTKAEIIDQLLEFASLGIFEGLTDSYTGAEVLTGLGNGLAYYEGDTSVHIVAAPVPVQTLDGDFNEDGSYDAADYVAWRKINNTPEGYAAFVTDFGSTEALGGGAGGGASVPELSTLGLLACGVIWLPLARARKRNRQISERIRIQFSEYTSRHKGS